MAVKIYKNGEWKNVASKPAPEVVKVIATSDRTNVIAGKNVPDFNPAQITQIYNAVVNKKVVVIESVGGAYYFVKEVNSNSDYPTFYLLFENSHILKYWLVGNIVNISAVAFGDGRVLSVNGYDGNVVLKASDIKALNNQSIQHNLERIDENVEDVQEQIDNLKARGRFLSGWDAETGLPSTEPTTDLPYVYKAGDYYVVDNVGELINYVPTGASYTGSPSRELAEMELNNNDTFMYDGALWVYLSNTQKTITIQNVVGLESALDHKQEITLIESASDTTIGGLEVPSLTAEQIEEIFSALHHGMTAVVKSSDGEKIFVPYLADDLSGMTAVHFIYYDLVITYWVESGEVHSEYFEFATKTDLNDYAKKDDDCREEGLIAKFASNILTDRGLTIDASLTASSGQNFADRPNNAKGTGTYYPYGSADRISIKSETQKIENVYGHSYVKNQLNNNNASTGSSQGITFTNNSDGTWNLNGTSTGRAEKVLHTYDGFIAYHKYLLLGGISGDVFVSIFGLNVINGSAGANGNILTATGNGTARLLAYVESGNTLENVKIKPKLVDITQLDKELANRADLTPEMVLKAYPDIPNWEYTANPQMIDAEDFVYSSGGINQWDEQWENGYYNDNTGIPVSSSSYIRCKNHIRVISGLQYCVSKPIGKGISRILFYDKEKNFLYSQDLIVTSRVSTVITIPNNVYYIKFYSDSYTSYQNDIQICLHYTDTELENTYHPYVAPATKEIHYYGGVGRSAGSVRDEIDYVAKKRIKRVGSVDLGTLNWTLAKSNGFATEGGVVNQIKKITSITAKGNLICSKYNTITYNDYFNSLKVGIAIGTSALPFLIVYDTSYSNLNDFKTAMSGVILNYELATPLEEDIPTAEQNNVLPCNDYSIESKSNGVIAGMKVLYQVNVVDTVFNNKEDIELIKNSCATKQYVDSAIVASINGSY